MFLIFDTETTGLPRDYNAPITDSNNWPRLVQLAWQLHDKEGALLEIANHIVYPDGFTIPFNAAKIHGITTEIAQQRGIPLIQLLEKFNQSLSQTDYIVAHNVEFDLKILGAEYFRMKIETRLQEYPKLDTCTEITANLCQLPGGRGGRFKLPNLNELHKQLFNTTFNHAHNASSDVAATSRCFLELLRTEVVPKDKLKLNDQFFMAFKLANPTVIKETDITIETYQNTKSNNSEKVDAELAVAENDGPMVPIAELNTHFGDMQQPKLEDEQAAKTLLYKPGESVNAQEFNTNDLFDPDLIDDEVEIEIQPIKTVETEELSASSFKGFAHLKNRSTYTILNSTIEISELIQRSIDEKMPAIGLTDISNLMGAFKFVSEINQYNSKEDALVKSGVKTNAEIVKAVLGCEMYVCQNHANKSLKDNGSLVTFFAKNKTGYKNLSMLSSLSFTDGFYYVPRIDKELILKHKNGLIVTTGELKGEIPNLFLNMGEHKAEEALLWWKEHFGDNFYIELNRHGLEAEDEVNAFLIQMAKKHHIKYFAANNVHYLDKEDAEAHDFLLCIKDASKKSAPIGKGYGFRFGFPNNEYYFKTAAEMEAAFADIPEAIDTIAEIIAKIEPYSIGSNLMLPEFTIPEAFNNPLDAIDGDKRGENAYLRHLTYIGAEKRYGEITDEIRARIDFELDTIALTKYPGYFLIVQDLIDAARKMGVWVGPGRGSAAGSVVAYCLYITNIDPLQYGLLFERFLNPDRVTFPDIDIDFDDEGRSKVIDYVINKYGKNKVAQIITYGTLGTKSAIRDIGRALEYDQALVGKLAASTANIKLRDFFNLSNEKLKVKYRPEQLEAGELLKSRVTEDSKEGRILKNTIAIEGLVRNTGIHACGFVISPTDLRELVPVTISKESNLWATQFDNAVTEKAGLLKVDFLGLKTLSLIRDTCEIVQQRKNISLNPDTFPLDDEKTFQLFQKGETVGVFQYESSGMQKHLKDLKPTAFTDLIALNALYRPGPMAYIPSYIKRKHGVEPIGYDLPEMKEILEETYGVTVYQEQVMLLSNKLVGFSKGKADELRRGMGKKEKDKLDKLYPLFIEGGKKNGHSDQVLAKIWKDWIVFANYAFNKSHSAGYALVAFQTAYLKANFPAEFMASVLSNNINDIKQVSFFMEECKRMKLNVLGPDVNESQYKFTVNDKGDIRFGMGAIKNMGESAALNIISEREANGPYKSVFNFLVRINLRNVNKRNIESLATSGAFDSFNSAHRAQFFYQEIKDGPIFLEKAMRIASQHNDSKNSTQINLFGEESAVEFVEPQFPNCEPWSKTVELQHEFESIGFYISAHPMDNYKLPIKYFANSTIQYINANIADLQNHKLVFAGQIITAEHLTSQQGKTFCRFKMEDHNASIELMVFGEMYHKVKHLIGPGIFVMVHAQPQPSFRDKEKKELKITDIQLLESIIENSSRDLVAKIRVADMTKHDMIQLMTEVKENKGGINNLIFHLVDSENSISVKHLASRFKVNAATLMPLLDRYDFLDYDFK